MNQNIEKLHDAQSAILVDIWQAYEIHGVASSEVNRLNAEYDDTVVELLKLLGENAPASQIDMAQYEVFSNCYKSDTGIRPSGFTYAQMAEYMDRREKV